MVEQSEVAGWRTDLLREEVRTAFGFLERLNALPEEIGPEDVQGLLQAGLSEDEIFEATVAAALGAGLKRLRAGLAALGEE